MRRSGLNHGSRLVFNRALGLPARARGTHKFRPTPLALAIALGLAAGSALADDTPVTVVAGATLTLNEDTTIGSLSGAGNVATAGFALTTGGNNATTAFDGVISGTGSLTKAGSGEMVFTGANTYTGGTTISGGGLQVGNGGTSGAITGDVINNNALTFYRSDSLYFDGDISGTGLLGKSGDGTLGLGGTNTYSGDTLVFAGTLWVEGGNAIGDSSAVTMNAGTTLMLGTDETIGSLDGTGNVNTRGFTLTTGGNNATTTFSGAISGSGRLIKTGSGTLTLSGTTPLAVATLIDAGTLRVGSGSVLSDNAGVAVFTGATLVLDVDETLGALYGSGSVYLGSHTLTFGGARQATFDGDISGSGRLTLAGTGRVVLNGNNSYSGGTFLGSGQLWVGDLYHGGARLGGDVSITGGTLRGHGSIDGNVTNTAGTLFPGSSLGILTINGNYVQGAGGTLAIEVSPEATAGVGYDQLVISGSASLDGTLQLVVGNGIYDVGTTYDIVKANGGVTGSFASTSITPAFAAYLTPELSYGSNAVTLTLAPTPGAFTSGNSVLQQLFSVNHMTQQAFDVVRADLPGAASPARSGVWLQGLGVAGRVSRFDLSNGGLMLGNSAALADDLLVGGALALAETRTDDGDTLVQGRSWGGYGYGLYTPGHWRLFAAVGAGQLDTDSTRSLPALGAVSTGRSDGYFTGITVGGRYHVALNKPVFAEPYAEASVLRSQMNGYQERGAGLLDIRYGNEAQDLTVLEAGARVGLPLAVATATVVPWLRAGAVRYLGDRTVENAESVGMANVHQSLDTVRRHAFKTGAGVEVLGQGPWSASLAWDGQYADQVRLDKVQLVLQYQW